ncbi:MAG: glycine zipper family protein [Nitrospinaceae bacterium]
MLKRVLLFFTLTSLILTGCASRTGWTPTVDPYNDPNAAYIERDKMECRQLAKQASGDTAMETGKGALIGGALGAAAGAAIGAAVGSPGRGAAIGAAAGGIGGGAHEGFGAEDQYKRTYLNCMRNRGHNVIN